MGDIVSGWMGTIESKSIIPPSPTDDSQRTTPDSPSCMSATGIDMRLQKVRSRDRPNLQLK
ncbi:hypothetical protein Q5692_04800 [Microcoleus sp. C2C3]|uniref:hypothetical protein n=1 Tax=unclassified Microcoleus TaxID=2642155 RepID=UPI002FD505F2